MVKKLGESFTLDFITSNSTGAAADADATPTCEVFEDSTDTPIVTPTVVKRTSKTGNYRVLIVGTTGNGFEAGKSYNAVVTATCGGVAGCKSVIGHWQVRSVAIDDVLRATPTAGDGTTYAVDTDLAADVWAASNRSLTDKAGFSLTTGERAAIATKVEQQIILDTDGQAVLEAIVEKISELEPSLGDLTADAVAVAVWAYSSRTITGGTITTLTGHTPQTGDAFARIGATGSGLSSLAPAATALSTVTWTGTKAGYIDAPISGVSTGGVSVGSIADAVWDEARTGHTTSGTFGSYLDAAVSAGGDGGTDEGIAVPLGTVTGTPSTTQIKLTALTLDGDDVSPTPASGTYNKRTLLFGDGTLNTYRTDKCTTHTVSGSGGSAVHTFNFSSAQKLATVGDVARVV